MCSLCPLWLTFLSSFFVPLSKIWLGGGLSRELVVPAWTAGTQVDMDVSGRILGAWMPAIHAGMTEALMAKMALNLGVGVDGCISFFTLRRRA